MSSIHLPLVGALEEKLTCIKTADCSILHTKQLGLLDYVTTILLSSSNASTCKTRAQAALPCAACSHRDLGGVYNFVYRRAWAAKGLTVDTHLRKLLDTSAVRFYRCVLFRFEDI